MPEDCRITYSLIVPHYDYVKGLMRLCSTIPQRDDLEVIIVDDCSCPEAVAQIAAYCAGRKGFTLLSTDINGGGGKARNVGLDAARGRYVFFADCDDFFLPSLSDILDRHADSTADIIFFNAISLRESSYLPSGRAKHLQSYIQLSQTDFALASLRLRYLFGEPWCKIVRRDMLTDHGIRFQESRLHNDTYFSYMAGHCAISAAIDQTAAYVVIAREDSVSVTVDWDKIALRTDIFSKKNRFFKEIGVPVYDGIIFSSFYECLKAGNKTELDRNISIAIGNGMPSVDIDRQIRGYRRMMEHPRLHRFINSSKEAINRVLSSFKLI